MSDRWMPTSSTTHDATPRTLARAAFPRRVRQVLESALTLVSVELDNSLRGMLDEFEQELFRFADQARNPGVESGYMQTLRTLRLNRADLIPRFMLELEGGLAAIRSPVAPRAAQGDAAVSFRNLALVEETVMDEGAVLREIATRRESRAGLTLHLLGQRFGVLAGAPALEPQRMPLAPQALCRAMHDASLTLQVSYEARLLLYQIFDRQVMARYGRVLEKLDETMAAQVLPGLTFVPVRVRTAPAEDGPQRSPEHADPARGQDPAPPADAAAAAATAGEAAPTGPQRRASDGDTAPAPAARQQDSQRPHTAWMTQAAAEDEDEQFSLDALQQLISGRRELIDKLRPARAGSPRMELPTREVFGALGALQRQASAASIGTLPDIRQTLLAQARQQHGQAATLSQRDNDTFELLALLYAQIEERIRPDAPAGALIKRLQLPLLRLALQDRAFFVRPRHPARQLLDTISECAAKWLDKDDFDPQLFAPLQQAVSEVVTRYDGDEQVFAASNAQLETHLQAHVRKAEVLERRHVEAARGKEKLEVAKNRAAETLGTLIGEQRLAKFVRALLQQAWADVLTLTLLRQGEHSAEWRHQVDVTRAIVVACGRDAPPDPALRQHVETALAQVGYHADEAAVIAQRLTSHQVDDSDDSASRTELTIRLKARARLGEDAARAQRPKLPPRTPDEQVRYDQLRVLPFGAWIEFVINQQGDVSRRRLSWFSPITDNALFVNQRGQRLGDQSLDALARMLASGQAGIVTADQGRLVDRAWQAALGALRSFAGRGDAPASAAGAS